MLCWFLPFAAVGCFDPGARDKDHPDSGDADTDGDTDADTDGDTDADTDGDTDGDTDTDSDTDADTDPVDADGDGYTADLDCDDTDAAVHPGAPEVCDALDVDEDCDGRSDAADSDLTDGTQAFADADGDGFGDPDAAATVCELGGAYVADATDCDDTHDDTFPGAEERCADTRDQDCDGDATCALTVDDASRELVGESAGDYAGWGLGAGGDLDGDGYADVLVGAIGPGGMAGEAYVVAGGATGDLDLSAAAAALSGEHAGDEVGGCVAPAGDVDGDGQADILVSAHYNDDAGSNAGKVYLVLGPVGSGSLSSADVAIVGENADDYAGIEVAGGSDVSGDGTPDVLVGAYGYGSEAGAAYLLTNLVGASVDLSAATAVRTGETAGDRAGLRLDLVGDLDADGYGDVVVGAAQQALAGGMAYVVLGPVSGTASLATADARLDGPGTGGLGAGVRGAGDVDGDGYDDFLVSNYADEAWLVHGPVSGVSDVGTAASVAFGGSSGDHLGTTLDGGGDIDGDGNLDFVVGAYSDDASTGAAYVYFGPLAGSVGVADADVTVRSTAVEDYLASKVRFVGDHDGDGRDDFALAAWGEDDGGSLSGAVWVFLTSEM